MILNVLLSLMTGLVMAAETGGPVEKLLSEQKEEIFLAGKSRYQKYCIACHASSNIMVASPKFADKEDWGSRLISNKSLKNLTKSAFKGKGAMPAKGLCLECKEKDLQAAILYMMRGLD